MNKISLDDIVSRLRVDSQRWDAILDLKVHATPGWIPKLIELLKDKEWVIRWCVSEVLGDLSDRVAIPALIEALSDEDPHVVKNAKKALVKFKGAAVSDLAPLYAHSDLAIRTHVQDIMSALGDRILDALFAEVRRHDWVISNRLAYAIYSVSGKDAEHMLVSLLDYEPVQKNVTLMLGLMKSKVSIPYFIRFHDNPSIRRVVLQAIKMVGKEVAFPLIIKALAKSNYAEGAEALILRIGPPMFPALQTSLSRDDLPKEHLFRLMIKIGHPQLNQKFSELLAETPGLKPYLDKAKV